MKKILTPVKNTASGILARIKDHGSEIRLKLKHTMTADSDLSQSSPPRTPPANEATTMDDFFNSSAKLPSPPRNKMTVGEVEGMLKLIFPNFEELRDSDDPKENEKYYKLANLLRYHKLELAKTVATMIIDQDCPHGKRFHTLFSVHEENDRQWTLGENDKKKMRIREYEYYIESQRLPEVKEFRANQPACIYEGGDDIEHGTDVYFIIQNFWQKKQFILVRRDYFRTCSVDKEGGTSSVSFVTFEGKSRFESADHEEIFAKKATTDVSLSSSHLERPSAARTMTKVRVVDAASGKRRTHWIWCTDRRVDPTLGVQIHQVAEE